MSAITRFDRTLRILSYTEHNQRLLLNPTWQCAREDLAELEAEAERRADEDEQRGAAARSCHAGSYHTFSSSAVRVFESRFVAITPDAGQPCSGTIKLVLCDGYNICLVMRGRSRTMRTESGSDCLGRES
ncbi:Uu.00g133870.m01.CDS01 [Anthostomella pinea]|uniref:Uu.00g133870.m01.CDS01 n=1 Tax=Anthostomella pinea TaxID=933095 RepID=A0AAI8VNT9_9PEZI|nr:Uu.00g133870.m01.CDS01 [Anthostomella pinea]